MKHVDGKWQAGDSFSIWAPNDTKLVTTILRRLGITSEKEMHKPIKLNAKGDNGVELSSHLSQLGKLPYSKYING